MKTKTKTKQMVVSALLIALGTILSMLVLFELPFGGSVTIASMVPVVLISYIYGVRWGMATSFVYALLQLALGVMTGIVSKMFLPGDEKMVFSSAITICLLDYMLAYLVLGLGGIFKGKLKNEYWEIFCGAFFATFLRYVMHVLSGYIFYGAWAEWFFGASDGLLQIKAFIPFCTWVIENLSGNVLSLFYSVVYNAFYMIPEIIITVVLTPIVYKTMKKTKSI